MSRFRKNDIVRYNHNNLVYYVQVADPGTVTNSFFHGRIVQSHDTNWTPEEVLRDPNKILKFSAPDGWFTVVDQQDVPRDPYILFHEALDTLERQL